MKCWAGWSTSWNRDGRERCQQPQICRWHHPYGRKWRGTKEPLDESVKVKEKVKESKKDDLKLNIQKLKIMVSSAIILWQIDGETMETMRDFIFLGCKTTADGDCSHEIKRHLLCERKAMTNLDSMLKSRDITLPTKVHLVKAMVFSSSHVWMWELDYKESWAFELWYWRRRLRIPWTARRSNQSILKEISP